MSSKGLNTIVVPLISEVVKEESGLVNDKEAARQAGDLVDYLADQLTAIGCDFCEMNDCKIGLSDNKINDYPHVCPRATIRFPRLWLTNVSSSVVVPHRGAINTSFSPLYLTNPLTDLINLAAAESRGQGE